jgi:hypothetical protein
VSTSQKKKRESFDELDITNHTESSFIMNTTFTLHTRATSEFKYRETESSKGSIIQVDLIGNNISEIIEPREKKKKGKKANKSPLTMNIKTLTPDLKKLPSLEQRKVRPTSIKIGPHIRHRSAHSYWFSFFKVNR